MASKGHIKDLANSGKGGLGVDVENGFTPRYIISKDKYKIVNELKTKKRECDEVIIATDPDREGEAIAWHLATELGLDIEKTKRLEFHEITRESIINAINNPRTIDINLVNSQESRRIVDRIIGYKLSNLLMKKIRANSAGRVQSATLRLIAEHEKEINEFVPEEYYNINCKTKINDEEITLSIIDSNGKSLNIKTKEEADEIINKISNELSIVSIEKTVRTKESKEPFKTSTLQQEASTKLKFKTKDVARIAQSLYEGIEVNGESVGLITYTRTDTSVLSPVFVEKAKKYIDETFGSEYLSSKRKVKNSLNAQGAHEAIRHTSNHRTPESIKAYLSPAQYKLYKLIYNRTLASLMAPKKEEVLTFVLSSNGVYFKFEIARTIFKGYEVVENKNEKGNEFNKFPNFEVGDTLPVIEKNAEQKFTVGPTHFTEGKIVSIMEELGIGRPSTYVPTISTLEKRKYIEEDHGLIKITPLGAKTAHVLTKYFPEFINVSYTAQIESQLDLIQNSSLSKIEFLSDTYDKFIEVFEKSKDLFYKDEDELVGRNCPDCGSPLVYKDSKHGRFIGCSNFPTCNYIEKEKPELEYTGENCPDCGSPLVKRRNAKNKEFVACSNFPKCNYIKQEPKENEPLQLVDKVCPLCGAKLAIVRGKFGKYYRCSNHPNCKHYEAMKFRKNKYSKK
jgi:DNA topoisomerase-1